MQCLVSNTRRFLQLAVIGLIFESLCANAEVTNSSPLFRVSQLMRMTVENRDGIELGRIREVLLDLDRGAIRAVLLGPEGFFASRKPLRAVPPQLLSPATAKRDIIALNASWKEWSEAPEFKTDQVNSLADPGEMKRIHRHFRQENTFPGRVDSGNSTGELTQTSREVSGTLARKARTALASDLMGNPVFGESRHKIGEVVDVLVPMNDDTAVRLLVVPSRSFAPANHGFALPWRLVQRSQSGRLEAHFTFAELTNAPVWDARRGFGEKATEACRYPLQRGAAD